MAKEVKIVPSPSSSSEACESNAIEDSSGNHVDASCLADQFKRLSLPRVGLSGSKEQNFDYEISNLPPPPEYPKWIDTPLPLTILGGTQYGINEKLNLSRSQPDLSRIGIGKIKMEANKIMISPR